MQSESLTNPVDLQLQQNLTWYHEIKGISSLKFLLNFPLDIFSDNDQDIGNFVRCFSKQKIIAGLPMTPKLPTRCNFHHPVLFCLAKPGSMLFFFSLLMFNSHLGLVRDIDKYILMISIQSNLSVPVPPIALIIATASFFIEKYPFYLQLP